MVREGLKCDYMRYFGEMSERLGEKLGNIRGLSGV